MAGYVYLEQPPLITWQEMIEPQKPLNTKVGMPSPQTPPIRIEAPSASPDNAATFIFQHGYGDDGDGWTSRSPVLFIIV
jgi:hypothetical protein